MPMPETAIERKSKELKEQKAKGNNLSTYTPEIGEWICEIVATNAIGLKRLYDKHGEEGFPHPDTIIKWRYKHPEFRDAFLEAKKFQSELYIEETHEIAENRTRDLLMTDKGEVANSTAVSRDKLIIDVRKFHVGKLLPRIYGDKTYNETTLVLSHEDMLKELE